MIDAAPALETERLILRAHARDDYDACAAMWADENVVRFITGVPSTPQQTWMRVLTYAGHWRLMGFGYWAVIEKSSGSFAGELGYADFRRAVAPKLHGIPELGFAFAPGMNGKGYATEAARAAAAWADANLSAERTVSMAHPENAASIRVLEKTGYRPFDRTDTTVFYERARVLRR